MGCRFKSPKVKLMIPPKDYIKYISYLDNYIGVVVDIHRFRKYLLLKKYDIFNWVKFLASI